MGADRVHPRAGLPAGPRRPRPRPPARDRVLRRGRPDPSVAGRARRVRHVRTPRIGARGLVQRGAHPRGGRGRVRPPQGRRDRRPALPRDRHARALGARVRQRARGARGPRDRGPRRRPRRVHADAGHLARDPRAQPGADAGPRRRHRDHAVAQPARGRRHQVQPAPRRPGRHGGHARHRGRGERAPRRGPRKRTPRVPFERARRLHHGAARLRDRLRRRPVAPSSTRGAARRGSHASAWIRSGGAGVAYWARIAERHHLP